MRALFYTVEYIQVAIIILLGMITRRAIQEANFYKKEYLKLFTQTESKKIDEEWTARGGLNKMDQIETSFGYEEK